MVKTQLENYTVNDFVLNTTLIDNTSELVSNIATNASPASDGYFGIGVMLGLYLVLTYFFYRSDEQFRLDFAKASLFASGFSLGVGIIMFSLGWMDNYRHLLWVGLIYLLSFLVSWAVNRR